MFQVSELRWSDPRSPARTTANDGVVNYETLCLVAIPDGVSCIAKATHNDLPVRFRLTRCS